jgi:HD-like signal output (HDOD) protein
MDMPITVSGGGTVANQNVFDIQIRRDSMTDREPLQLEVGRDHPDVPVMPETLLLLDLLVQETCVDLRQMSELVLTDLGATLQILRLAGREYGTADDRPLRIADCISDLGLRHCLKAVSAQTICRHERKSEVAALWAHSREIASCSRLVAREMSEIDPEEAYLVGLLHAIGMAPAVLGWKESSADDALIGLKLAKRWSLPRCVMEFFGEVQLSRYTNRWSVIVQEAHMIATRHSIKCSSQPELRPHLQRSWHGWGEPGPSL